MSRLRPSSWPWSLALRGVLALALLWGAALAPGVMPGRAADGALAFVLCTGEGEVLVTLDADGRPRPVAPEGPGDAGGRHAIPCAFAAVHAPAMPAPALLWALPDAAAAAAEAPPARPAPAPLPLALSDHLPRGPPAA